MILHFRIVANPMKKMDMKIYANLKKMLGVKSFIILIMLVLKMLFSSLNYFRFIYGFSLTLFKIFLLFLSFHSIFHIINFTKIIDHIYIYYYCIFKLNIYYFYYKLTL